MKWTDAFNKICYRWLDSFLFYRVWVCRFTYTRTQSYACYVHCSTLHFLMPSIRPNKRTKKTMFHSFFSCFVWIVFLVFSVWNISMKSSIKMSFHYDCILIGASGVMPLQYIKSHGHERFRFVFDNWKFCMNSCVRVCSCARVQMHWMLSISI